MSKTKVLAGLAAIATLFSLSSCISIDYNLGSAYIPEDQSIKTNIVELDIPVHQRMADSLQTAISSTSTFGVIRSEVYGEFSAMAVCSITPEADSIVLGDNPVFKEAYATFTLSQSEYLGSDQERIPQNIHVYQLTKQVDSSMVYSCSVTHEDYIKNPVTLENTIFTGGDTFNIRFTDDFAKPILNMTEEVLDSTELFVKAFNGIVITTDPLEEGALGGRLNILDLSESYMYLTYTSTNYEGRRRDTTLTFNIGSYYSLSSYESQSDRLLETADPRQVLHMEGLTGIKPFISAAELKAEIDEWALSENIDLASMLVTRATLTFPFENTGNPDDYANYPQSLFPCQRIADTVGRVFYTPLLELDEDEMTHGSANFSHFYFKSDAASYIQDLIRTDYDELTYEDDLWIMPTVEYTTTTSTPTYNPYSTYYSPYSSYYGYGYSSYGYGYGYGSYYNYGTTYSTTTTTYNYPDIYYYTQCTVNGTDAERHPTLRITYTIVN